MDGWMEEGMQEVTEDENDAYTARKRAVVLVVLTLTLQWSKNVSTTKARRFSSNICRQSLKGLQYISHM